MITAVAILGSTATGKSRLGMSLARERGGEILSFDSRQAYRRIDIGTAKPSSEERRAVPHHLIDILDLHEKNNAQEFARAAHEAIRNVASRGKLAILVGGSGLYLRAITEGFFDIALDRQRRIAFEQSLRNDSDAALHARLTQLDPESARRIHRNDRYRVIRALEVHALTGEPLSEHLRRHRSDPMGGEVHFIKIGLTLPRPALHRSIGERTRAMFERGWVDEVRRLLDSGVDPSWPGMKTLGYPQIIAHAGGMADRSETETRVIELTRQYAKRQITWFRKERNVAWLDADARDLVEIAIGILEKSAQR